MTTVRSVLFATVGGSHQPILTAIRELKPDHIVFYCTGPDPATGKAGSEVQIRGKGLCIKAKPGDEKPTLPNIPTQAKLAEEQFEVVTVPADDLDGAFAAMLAAMREVAARFPGANRVADYTGGTKTMTAALVEAALESGDVEIQLVTGGRADLVKVQDGTQSSAPASVEGVRLRRAMQPFLDAWGRYAYDEAAAGLGAIPLPRGPSLRPRLLRARALSAAFAAWDRFDHVAAASELETHGAVLPETWKSWIGWAKALAGPESPRRTGLQIWDLWLNALRRATAGRYDDAVARAYRMLEATAQWVLETRAGLKTGDLPQEVAGEVGISPGRDGRSQAPLFAAWELVARRAGGQAAVFFETERSRMLDHLARRNRSILAHGFTPVAAPDWSAMQSWLEDGFLTMLRGELATVGVRDPFPQLPDRYVSREALA